MDSRPANKVLLETHDLSVGYKHKNTGNNILLSDLDLQIKHGELITLIGPNGCGKSTLIRSLSGLLSVLKGYVTISGIKSTSLSASEKADILGIVLTDPVYEKNMTIFELVAMGRYHYTNWLGSIGNADREIILDVIKKVGLQKKKDNRLSELSDGERQRAMIAKVLAQDVDLIILDEPTAHLDLPNRMELLLLLKQLSRKMGKGILLSTHELSLGMQVSDKVWLVNNEGKLEQSIPEELMLNNSLNNTFGTEHISFHPFSASFELVPDKIQKAQILGDGLMTACVIRLLKRLGIQIVHQIKDGDLLIEVDEHKQLITVNKNSSNTFSTLYQVQDYLLELLNQQ